MKRAAVRLGRVYAGETEIPEGRLYYGHRMKLALWQKDVPLLVDHDEARQIGRVRELYTFKDTSGDWLTVSVELDPDAPGWVRKGTPASFKSALLNESSFVENYIYGAYVQEVSLLLNERPAEPAARVLLLYESEPEATVIEPVLVQAPAPRVSSRDQRELAELNRRIDAALAADPHADVGLIIENLKAELGYYQRPWWQAA